MKGSLEGGQVLGPEQSCLPGRRGPRTRASTGSTRAAGGWPAWITCPRRTGRRKHHALCLSRSRGSLAIAANGRLLGRRTETLLIKSHPGFGIHESRKRFGSGNRAESFLRNSISLSRGFRGRTGFGGGRWTRSNGECLAGQDRCRLFYRRGLLKRRQEGGCESLSRHEALNRSEGLGRHHSRSGRMHPRADLGIRTISGGSQSQEEAKAVENPFQSFHVHSPYPRRKHTPCQCIYI